MFMPKQPISVTLEEDNILWLKGRAHAAKRRSLSDALDQVVTAARTLGQAAGARSVAGTIDIAASDPGLTSADAALRRMFDVSLTPAPRKRTGPKARGAAARG